MLLVKLLRFYQQYKIEDFLNMDVLTFGVLVNGMNRITAAEHLMAMDYSIYAHISDKDRKKQHKKWYKEAYPEAFEERTVKTSDLELI